MRSTAAGQRRLHLAPKVGRVCRRAGAARSGRSRPRPASFGDRLRASAGRHSAQRAAHHFLRARPRPTGIVLAAPSEGPVRAADGQCPPDAGDVHSRCAQRAGRRRRRCFISHTLSLRFVTKPACRNYRSEAQSSPSCERGTSCGAKPKLAGRLSPQARLDDADQFFLACIGRRGIEHDLAGVQKVDAIAHLEHLIDSCER